MTKQTDPDFVASEPTLAAGLEAAARARSQLLNGQSAEQRNTARTIEESIREGLLGETMLSPDPRHSAYIDRRGRALAGLPQARLAPAEPA